jgi:hypothetical protein
MEYNKLLINTLSLEPKKIYFRNRLETVNTTVRGKNAALLAKAQSKEERRQED